MNKEASSIRSYVIGFALSLVFTLVPYYMVTNHVFAGALLAVIMGFAVLQLIVQVLFFLHLGRGPQPSYNVIFFLNTIGIIFVVVGGSLWIMSHLNHNYSSAIDVTNKISQDEAVHQVEGAQTGTCPGGTAANHEVSLKSGVASPVHTVAKLCDTLIIVNDGDAVRNIAFGPHDKHESYAGSSGGTLYPGHSMVVTLTQTGTYLFHDHLLDQIQGDFTVNP